MLGAIAGGVAEARFGVAEWTRKEIASELAAEHRTLLERLQDAYGLAPSS